MALLTAAVQVFTESLSFLLAREVGDLNIAANLFKELKCWIKIQYTQHGLEDPSCRPPARSSSRGYPSITERDVDTRKGLYSKFVLSDVVSMFQGVGEQMAKECNVSYTQRFFFSNSKRRSQLGHKVVPAEGGVLECTLT